MTAPTDRPDVAFALPGEWIRVDLADDRQVDEVASLLDERSVDAASWLASARALGGVVLMFRIRSEPTIALLFAWPPEEDSGGTSLSALRNRVGHDGDVIDHAGGYACVRVRSSARDTDVLTYGIVHPDSGRMLLVRVTAFDGTFDPLDLEVYDVSVSRMLWEEPDA